MFRNYLLTAYKVFMRRKLFTAINLVCIVLTLLVPMVVMALIENTFFPSGMGKSDRVLEIGLMRSESPKTYHFRTTPLGYKLIEKYLKPMKSVERVAATTALRTVPIYQDSRLTELKMRRVDADYWSVLDFTLLAGRLPTIEDDDLGRHVAVINKESAAKLFGSATAIGKTVSIDGQQLRVIGVVEMPYSDGRAFADIWAPLGTLPSSAFRHEMHGDFTALLLARDKSDIPMIRKDVEAIARSVEFDDPKQWHKAMFWADGRFDAFARAMLGNFFQADSGATKLLTVVGAAMLVFLLLPALNLVNLNSGRILERSSEIGVRKAFGATNAQLAGQLIVENVLLCLVGGIVGLACTVLALSLLQGPSSAARLLNLAFMGTSLLITLVFGLLSGVLPAWKMSRLDPVHALKGTI